MKIGTSDEANRSNPHTRNITIIVTDRNNANFAGGYISGKLYEFFKKTGIPVEREDGYNILKIETTEWEIV